MRLAVRVCRGVRGLETKVRDWFEDLRGWMWAEGVFGRRDAAEGWRGDDWRRSRRVEVAFMLVRLRQVVLFW